MKGSSVTACRSAMRGVWEGIERDKRWERVCPFTLDTRGPGPGEGVQQCPLVAEIRPSASTGSSWVGPVAGYMAQSRDSVGTDAPLVTS